MKLELLPPGALLTVPAHGEGGSLGKGVLLGVLGRWSRCRALGSDPLEEERRWYLLRKAFIRCDLIKVTIFNLLNYNKAP